MKNVCHSSLKVLFGIRQSRIVRIDLETVSKFSVMSIRICSYCQLVIYEK